jgi:hypothetical protein
MMSEADKVHNEVAEGRGYWKLHAEAFHQGEMMGKLDNQDAMIELLDNADFLYFVSVLQDQLLYLRNEEQRVAERAEAKTIVIELIRGTQ